jgi:hypothetical protein
MALKIERSRGACSLCSESFKNGSVYVSRLYVQEDVYKRVDACATCEEKVETGAVAEWKVKVEKRKKLVLSESAIWQVLKNKNDPELSTRPLTFILCLMLARKRKLRLIATSKVKGQEFQTFENKSRGVSIKVQVPALGPAAFHQLQQEIETFFSGDA